MDRAAELRSMSIGELRPICHKGPGELFLFSKYVYRPFTIYITWLYARLGVSPTWCTMHSQICALAAAVLLLWPSPVTFIGAAMCLQAYFALDHVDGELARLYSWLQIRPLRASGDYFDFWVHFHSANLALGALGVGFAVSSGNAVWGGIGLLACSALSNFPKLVLSRSLVRLMLGDRRLLADDKFIDLAMIAADKEAGRAWFFGDMPRRRALMYAMRELLLFPGVLITFPVVMLLDVALANLGLSPFGLVSKAFLVTFAGIGVASKLRRTTISMRMLDAVGTATDREGVAVHR